MVGRSGFLNKDADLEHQLRIWGELVMRMLCLIARCTLGKSGGSEGGHCFLLVSRCWTGQLLRQDLAVDMFSVPKFMFSTS
jgi:hypothetical protein